MVASRIPITSIAGRMAISTLAGAAFALIVAPALVGAMLDGTPTATTKVSAVIATAAMPTNGLMREDGKRFMVSLLGALRSLDAACGVSGFSLVTVFSATADVVGMNPRQRR